MTLTEKFKFVEQRMERQSRMHKWKFNANYTPEMYEQSWGHNRAFSRLYAIRRKLRQQVSA